MAEAYYNPNRTQEQELQEQRRQLVEQVDRVRKRYKEVKEKIMPFFEQLAARALGPELPTGYSQEGLDKRERVKVNIRNLVNGTITTHQFLNEMRSTLMAEVPPNLHEKLDNLIRQVKDAKKEWDNTRRYAQERMQLTQQPTPTPIVVPSEDSSSDTTRTIRPVTIEHIQRVQAQQQQQRRERLLQHKTQELEKQRLQGTSSSEGGVSGPPPSRIDSQTSSYRGMQNRVITSPVIPPVKPLSGSFDDIEKESDAALINQVPPTFTGRYSDQEVGFGIKLCGEQQGTLTPLTLDERATFVAMVKEELLKHLAPKMPDIDKEAVKAVIWRSQPPSVVVKFTSDDSSVAMNVLDIFKTLKKPYFTVIQGACRFACDMVLPAPDNAMALVTAKLMVQQPLLSLMNKTKLSQKALDKKKQADSNALAIAANIQKDITASKRKREASLNGDSPLTKKAMTASHFATSTPPQPPTKPLTLASDKTYPIRPPSVKPDMKPTLPITPITPTTITGSTPSSPTTADLIAKPPNGSTPLKPSVVIPPAIPVVVKPPAPPKPLYPPPPESLLKQKLFLGLQPLNMLIHKNVHAQWPDYDPEKMSRIGEDIHEVISKGVETWMADILRQISKVHAYRLDQTWLEQSEGTSNPKAQLNSYGQWTKRLLEREEEMRAEALRRRAKNDKTGEKASKEYEAHKAAELLRLEESTRKNQVAWLFEDDKLRKKRESNKRRVVMKELFETKRIPMTHGEVLEKLNENSALPKSKIADVVEDLEKMKKEGILAQDSSHRYILKKQNLDPMQFQPAVPINQRARLRGLTKKAPGTIGRKGTSVIIYIKTEPGTQPPPGGRSRGHPDRIQFRDVAGYFEGHPYFSKSEKLYRMMIKKPGQLGK
eukprot:m.186487 g.186487  ORF g.186487 m.186487 type:complete len:880 (+) comp32271_c2_seq1:225-2864(+)